MTKNKKDELTQIDFANLCESVARAKRDLEIDEKRMAEKIATVQRNHAERQADLKEQIKKGERIAAKFAKANPDLFGKLRSVELVGCRVGFRTGNWTFSTAKGVTLKALADLMRGIAWAKDYVRTVYETDKERLIADREKLTPDQIAQIGIKFEREERFYIESTGDSGVTL